MFNRTKTGRKWAHAIVGLLGWALGGCVHYMPAAVSCAPLGPQERPVAVTKGEASAYYLFGFLGPMGNDSLSAAVDDALRQQKADTMMNVFVDRHVLNFPFDFFPLTRKITTTVYGTLVRYTDTQFEGNVTPVHPKRSEIDRQIYGR